MASHTHFSSMTVTRRAAHALTLASAAVLLCVVAFLAVRRAIGSLVTPPPPIVICVAGVAVAAVLSLMRLAITPHQRNTPYVFVYALATIGLAGFCLTLPGTAAWALVLFWCVPIGLEVFWAIQGRSPQRRLAPPNDQPAADEGASSSAGGSTTNQVWSEEECEKEDEQVLPAEVIQQVSQVLDETGRTTYFGTLRARFSPTERHTVLHVAFCPPLPEIPQLAVDQIGGPGASVKVGELQVYGTRLEVKRNPPYESAADVLLQFQTYW